MKYLITGITGMAGPHLASLLVAQGHQVHGLIRQGNGRESDILDVVPAQHYNEILFVLGDLLHRRSLERIFTDTKYDGVFHLAAQSHPPTSFREPYETFETNAIGSLNIMDVIASVSAECKMLNCSTSEVYGAVPIDAGDITEEYPLKPMNPYGVSKAAADLYASERGRSLGLGFFSTRAFSHTGPRRGKTFSISSDAYQIVRIKKGLQERLSWMFVIASGPMPC
jgi:GDP-4-dehydro-6-deoxy-D-mannose reductase